MAIDPNYYTRSSYVPTKTTSVPTDTGVPTQTSNIPTVSVAVSSGNNATKKTITYEAKAPATSTPSNGSSPIIPLIIQIYQNGTNIKMVSTTKMTLHTLTLDVCVR